MALSQIFYALRDNNNAGNAALNFNEGNAQAPATTYTLQFSSGTSGDLLLDWVVDDADADNLPEFDPDTTVLFNGVERQFAVLLTGDLPLGSPRVPNSLEGKTVVLIKVDTDGDGVLEDTDRQYFFVADGSGTLQLMQDFNNGSIALIPSSVDNSPGPTAVCFCSGSDIATPSGPRKVETLAAGDMVLTDGGEARQVIWVGCSRQTQESLLRHPNLRPGVIPAGALSPGLPLADLHLSPQHRIVMQGPTCELLFGTDTVLVAVKFLVGTLADVAPVTGPVDYFHILLEDHDMLVSNGLPTESFQPARRTIDVMDDVTRSTLEGVLGALGAEEMLTRKDHYQSLKQPEAQVLLDRICRQTPQFDSAPVGPKFLARAS